MNRKDPFGHDDEELILDEEPLFNDRELDKGSGRGTGAPSPGFSDGVEWLDSPRPASEAPTAAPCRQQLDSAAVNAPPKSGPSQALVNQFDPEYRNSDKWLPRWPADSSTLPST